MKNSNIPRSIFAVFYSVFLPALVLTLIFSDLAPTPSSRDSAAAVCIINAFGWCDPDYTTLQVFPDGTTEYTLIKNGKIMKGPYSLDNLPAGLQGDAYITPKHIWYGDDNEYEILRNPDDNGNFTSLNGYTYDNKGNAIIPQATPGSLTPDPITETTLFPWNNDEKGLGNPDIFGTDFDPNGNFPDYKKIYGYKQPDGSIRYFGTDVDGNRVELDPDTGKPLTETEMCTVDGEVPDDPANNDACGCKEGDVKDNESGKCSCKEGEERNEDGECEEKAWCTPNNTIRKDEGEGYVGPTLLDMQKQAKLTEAEFDKECACTWWTFTVGAGRTPSEPAECENVGGGSNTAEPALGGAAPGGAAPGGSFPGGGMPGGGALSGGLGDLGSMLGAGDMGGLMQAIGPLIGMLGQAMGGGQGGGQQGGQGGYPGDTRTPIQDNFPVDQSCLNELRTLQSQLESGGDAEVPSATCMGQLRTLLSDDEIDVVSNAFNDEEDNGSEDDNNGNENDKAGVEATACVETEAYNNDCTPKKVVQKDGKVTFGEGGESTTYKKRGDKDVFVDTETGEKFTWEEVLDREAVSEEDDDSLFNTLFGGEEDNSALINLIDDIFESKAGSIIASIFNSTNLANTYDRASGAVTNSFAAVGDGISSFMGRNRTENRQETTRVDNARTSN